MCPPAGKFNPGCPARREAVAELVAKSEAANITQARPLAWKSRPDLVDASRADGERVYHRRRAPMPEDSPGVAGQVYEVVTKWALEATEIPQNWNRPLAAINVDIWKSLRGRLLKDLYRDAMTHGDKVQKADRHAEARKILRALQDDPAACIIG
jgi:hypothetical protein